MKATGPHWTDAGALGVRVDFDDWSDGGRPAAGARVRLRASGMYPAAVAGVLEVVAITHRMSEVELVLDARRSEDRVWSFSIDALKVEPDEPDEQRRAA